MQNILRQSIIKTLSYFDLFNYPLTREELFAYLWQPPAIGYEEFLERLGALNAEGNILCKFGSYFLPGGEKNVEIRRRRLLISEQKLKTAKKAVNKIKSVPFLRAVFVCNTVGAETASAESDIDFFIITDIGRVWVVRFFTNLILRLFGLRTHKKVKDKICLSFFVDSNHLDLSPIRIAEDDVYLAYWSAQLFPLYDPQNYYAKFIFANKWLKKFMPNISDQVLAPRRLAGRDAKFGNIWKRIWEKMWSGAYGNLIENQAKGMQMARLKFLLKAKAAQNDKGVILSEGILKFHENDARGQFRKLWQSKTRNENQYLCRLILEQK